MAYAPTTDFLALLRQTGNSVQFARMPGLDYVVDALARAGMFRLFIGQTPPTNNQTSTVWLKPSLPTWVAEGSVFLWNAATGAFELATPALWAVLIAPSGYSFQSVALATGVINAGVTLLAVQRTAPANTALVLPSLISQWLTGRPLKIIDWSTTVTNHLVTLTPPDGSMIMRQTSWSLLSTADQLAGITLHPSPDLNGWVVAP